MVRFNSHCMDDGIRELVPIQVGGRVECSIEQIHWDLGLGRHSPQGNSNNRQDDLPFSALVLEVILMVVIYLYLKA